MDLSDPTRAITPTLDGPVLAVLAASGRPVTVGEVAAQTVRGSEIGVRRCLARLVDQGIVRATEVGRNRVHELNREHVAADIAVALAGLRLELWDRLRKELGRWKVRPMYACAFGSATRGDGTPESDIDVLLVHGPFPGEKRTTPLSGLRELLGAAALDMSLPLLMDADVARWHLQVDALRGRVHAWTGNPLQVIDVSAYEWADGRRKKAPIYNEIERDAVVLIAPTSLAEIASRPAKAR